MQLSVIILNYNVRYFLELCVLSVQKAIHDIDAEIIVVDNNSSDDSCEMIRRRFPEVILVENLENLGFPKGNNIGVAHAKGEFVCILNPDTVVAEDTFEKLLKFITSSAVETPQLGITGCKLIDGTGQFLPESKRGIPTPWVAFTKIFGLYKIFPKTSFLTKYYAQYLGENQTGKVEILVGAFMMMKRQLYLDLGGFDENCFMYSDDIDLSYLSLKRGKENFYFHDTKVIHYKGESTVKDGTYMKRFQEAMNFFYKKHFKVSFFFSVFMKIGAFLFSIAKKLQGQPKLKSIPKRIILISDNDNLLKKMQTNCSQKIELFNPKNIENFNFSTLKNHEVELIYDNNLIDFKMIIASMEKNQHLGLTYKILPENSNFIIGSNNRNDRGEVIKW